MRGSQFCNYSETFAKMGYEVEWRVIHADDYGFPQQRSRVFILAYQTAGGGNNRTEISGNNRYGASKRSPGPLQHWIFGEHSESGREDWEISPFAEAFPAKCEIVSEMMELPDVNYWSKKKSPFGTAGYAWFYGPSRKRYSNHGKPFPSRKSHEPSETSWSRRARPTMTNPTRLTRPS